MKSVHKKLREEGYLVAKIIKDDNFNKEVLEFFLGCAEGLYHSINIISSSISVKGEMKPEFIPKPKSHLVYVLYNLNYHEIKKEIKKIRFKEEVSPLFLTDGSRFLILNEKYEKSFLKLK